MSGDRWQRDLYFRPQKIRGLTTLRGDHTTRFQSFVKELEVLFSEEGFGGTFGVARVGDDNVKLAFALREVFEAIGYEVLGLGVIKANSHVWEILL